MMKKNKFQFFWKPYKNFVKIVKRNIQAKFRMKCGKNGFYQNSAYVNSAF